MKIFENNRTFDELNSFPLKTKSKQKVHGNYEKKMLLRLEREMFISVSIYRNYLTEWSEGLLL